MNEKSALKAYLAWLRCLGGNSFHLVGRVKKLESLGVGCCRLESVCRIECCFFTYSFPNPNIQNGPEIIIVKDASTALVLATEKADAAKPNRQPQNSHLLPTLFVTWKFLTNPAGRPRRRGTTASTLCSRRSRPWWPLPRATLPRWAVWCLARVACRS